MVVEWLEKRNGKGLLIIFDGWDELSDQLRQSSIAASIIHRKDLDQCSVIVTSRSYASSSLLKIDTLSKHVQVIGFSKEDISAVIIQTIQKDPQLAQELIDRNMKNYEKLNFTNFHSQRNEDSKLAMKLINDLKVREDVQSLCYIPLVCSMVILVYCKDGGHLPTTLTQLYENFILQTIRRHVEIKQRHYINPRTIGSLSSLPSQIVKPFQELCQIAYTNLASTRMTFSSHQLQSLSEAVKEDYLGLMTTFIDYDEEKYQFLHLSIQEFLAAWWIAKHEKKTEEVFKNHFDDDHFRMCLRFVAGLTHLEHESYQQFFVKQQVNLQCSTEQSVLLGFEAYYYSWFHQYQNKFSAFRHERSDNSDNFPILLLQLLYESQNTTLCQILAQSINDQSLCLVLYEWLSLFDWLCLNYFINNSNTAWNNLHLGDVSNEKLSVFTAGLINNSRQTQSNKVKCSIQEFYCNISFQLMPQVLRLLQLNSLRYVINIPIAMNMVNSVYTIMHNRALGNTGAAPKGIHFNMCNEIEKSISMNTTVQKLFIMTQLGDPLPNGVIEQLLKENNTLKTLVLDFANEFIPSSLNIVEVNTPLTALEIGENSGELMTSLLPHIKGLHCLLRVLLNYLQFYRPILHLKF
uniref:NACHT domain-containing protein n=1 Tax=Amphimedon queenslandica TaxID=400682 RepID=A0A1X7SU35_AMPQE